MAWNGENNRTHNTRIYYQIVQWKLPKEDQSKYSTDGASNGNSRESVYDFCIRNRTGDLIYAQADKIGISMYIEAKARSIQEDLRFSAMNSLQNMVIKTDPLTLKKNYSTNIESTIENWRNHGWNN